jgi:hypothetical protein
LRFLARRPDLFAQYMNWLRKMLGSRGREYRGPGFSVRVKPTVREAVSIIYTHQGITLNLDGERCGKEWERIEVRIPQEFDGEQTARIVCHLETAFQELGYGYVIARLGEVEVVGDAEREAAIVELREMGYEVEVSADRKQIRQKAIAGTPRQNLETLRKQTPRMMSLIQAIHGTRTHLQILAKSKEP